MKKILFYIPESLYSGTGTQEWMERVLKALSPHFEITIIFGTIGDVFRWSKKDVQERFGLCKNLMEIRYWRPFDHFYIPTFSAWLTIWKQFRSHNFIYMRYSLRLIDPVVQLLGILSGTKIVFGFHGYFNYPITKKLFFHTIGRLILRFADACHTINSTTGDFLKKMGARKIFFIPNFLLNESLPKKNLADYHGKLLFVGRNEHKKGLDLLSFAIKKIIKTYPQLQFVFFGSGKQKPIITRLQTRFPRNVNDRGYEHNKNKMYTGRKFLLLASREEPFGLTVIEAMSYGVPAIATPTRGPIDIISHGKDGFLIKAITPEAMTEGILAALKINKAGYEKISAAAYKKAREYYNQVQFVEKFQQMINRLTSG